MAISEINDKSLAASAVNLATNTVTGILPAANTVANLSPGNNIVINGAMQVAQRATSVAGLGLNQSTCQTLDRWKFYSASDGRLTMSQTADGPSGFANCMKLDCTTADTSIAAGEYIILQHCSEGQDLQQIKKGTPDAELITVSFYVKANAVFTFGLELFDTDNTRQITKLFATTTDWVKHSITFPADTTGAFADDNALSLGLNFWLHAGSTWAGGTLNSSSWAAVTNANRVAGISSFYSSTNNEFFLTGVQMEVGPVATPFDHRFFGQELQLCKRYFQKIGNVPAICNSSTTLTAIGPYPVELRTTPTVGQTGVFNAQNSSDINNTQSGTGLGSNFGTSTSMFQASIPNFSGLTAPEPILVAVPANNGKLFTLDAEL